MSAATVQGQPDTRETRVLIAASHEATRMGVRLALEDEAVCYEAATPAAGVDAALQTRPDLCLIDSGMGGSIGLVAEISARLPQTAIVLIGRDPDIHQLLAAFRAGATGYLPQDIDPGRLPDIVRGVLAGEAAVPRKLMRRLLEELRARETRRSVLVHERQTVALTRREWEVLELMRAKRTTREMAEELQITQVTVRRHVSALLHKLQVPDRRAAVELLREVG